MAERSGPVTYADLGVVMLAFWECGHIEVDDGSTHECDGRDVCSATYRPYTTAPELAALIKAEQAARGLDALFDGAPGRWTLDGRKVTEDASYPLLSLHDYLNDVERARQEVP